MAIVCFTVDLLKLCKCVLFLTCLVLGQLGEGRERELFCSFSTPADGTEAAANSKGSAHSADPSCKACCWCLGGLFFGVFRRGPCAAGPCMSAFGYNGLNLSNTIMKH